MLAWPLAPYVGLPSHDACEDVLSLLPIFPNDPLRSFSSSHDEWDPALSFFHMLILPGHRRYLAER